MWLQALFRQIQGVVLTRPGSVLAITAVATALALVLGLQVELRTSRTELAPADDPEQRRFSELVEEFNGSQSLVVAVEAGPEASAATLRGHVDALAERLAERPEIESVFHHVDIDWILRHGLSLAPPDDLRRTAEGLRETIAMMTATEDDPRLDHFFSALAEQIEEGLRSPRSPAGDDAANAARLTEVLTAGRRFLGDPQSVVSEALTVPPLRWLARTAGRDPGDGYLATRDGQTLFLFVAPTETEDSLVAHRRLVGAVREVAAGLARQRPGLRIALAGNPATTVEEMDTVARDTVRTAGFATFGVGFLTLLVFRWRSHAFLVLAALGVGVALAYGAVWFELGYLNLVTSAFVSTLIGVGVAYGIHPVSEYELLGAHSDDPVHAVATAYHRTGAAVSTAAVTTAVAFFSILIMRFRAFAELGLVAGFGVLLCLLAALVVLPALLVVYGRWRHGWDRSRRQTADGAAVDRLWVERGAAAVTRYPHAVTLVALGVTAVAAASAFGIRFDIDLLELLPRDAESVRTQRRMVVESDLSPLFNLVVANDLEELAALERRSAMEPTVREFQSVRTFLPSNPAASAEVTTLLADALGDIDLPAVPVRAEREALAAALDRLEGALVDASDDAFGAGLGEVAAALESARAEAQATAAEVRAASPEQVEEWNRALIQAWPWMEQLLAELRGACLESQPTVATLPAALRARFMTRDGRFLGFLLPAGGVFDETFLEAYVAASRRISPDSTGFPIVFHQMADRITRGFYRAVGVGAILVFLTLMVDYRHLGRTALAMLPLAVGVVWMLGAMRLLGLSFNFANLVAVPLIIGVGIDNGVHVVHRLVLEGKKGMSVVLRHTGRAILIASLTTMIGFGSLALASHRGLASLGLVLLLGVGACLVTSMFVLPNMLVAFGLVER